MFKKMIDRGVKLYIRFRAWLLAGVIIAVALLSLQDFLWSTKNVGVFVRTDSVAYLWGAENLGNGIGLGRIDGAGNFRPYTHWPPLYPLLLTAVNSMGFSSLESARLLGALFIVLLTVSTGLAVARLTDFSPWYVAGVLFVINRSPYFFDTNFYAMTEPLFLIFTLAGLLLLESYFERQKKAFLILAGLAVGFAMITRYAGLALLVSCGLALLLQGGHPWRKKMMDGLLMGSLAIAPLVLWIARNMFISGTATNRALAFIPISPAEWALAGNALLGWFSPIYNAKPLDIARPIVIIGVAIAASFLYFRFVPQRQAGFRGRFIVLVAVYAFCYVIFVVLSRLLFDQYIPLAEYRIQYPFLICCILLVVAGIYWIQVHAQRAGWLPAAILVTVYVFTAWMFSRGYGGDYITLSFIGNSAGFGLARDTDEQLSLTLGQYSQQDYLFFTDNVEKLYFMSSKYSYQITAIQLSQVKELITGNSDKDAVIVLFDQKEFGSTYQAAFPELELIYSGIADLYIIP